MSPGTSLPRSSPWLGGSPWKQPTRPRAPFCLPRVLTPQGAGAGAWEGAGFKTTRALPLGRRRWRRARREPRDTHRAAAAPPGPERKAREATQVPPQRRRKFESRSGKGPRLPAAPAHRQPLGTFTFHFPALEKEMATHSSALAWRIPWTEKPGRLQSMGSHRVRHD